MRLQLIVLIGVLLESSYSSQKRFRRVVNGAELKGRPRPYTAIRYYGALATAHHTWFTFGKDFEFLKYLGAYGTVYCSGSLLTPAIFQTACHCVADFDLSNKNRFIKPPLVDHQWEGRKVTYFGMSNRFGEESMVTYEYVLTEKFIVHSKCGGLGGENSITYDYALIQIDSGWLHRDTRGYNWLEIAWAPQYTVEQMEDFHHYALEKQLVCMIIGFGRFDEKLSTGSDVLRYGWTVLLHRSECKYETAYVQVGIRRVIVLRDYFNWVCSKQFPNHNEYSGTGDSGGPLSCNNRYFALLSGIKFYNDERGNKYDIITKYHPLIHSLLANSVNYRSDLINSIYRLKGVYTETIDKARGGRDGSEESFVLKWHDSKSLLTSNGLQIGPELFLLRVLVGLYLKFRINNDLK